MKRVLLFWPFPWLTSFTTTLSWVAPGSSSSSTTSSHMACSSSAAAIECVAQTFTVHRGSAGARLSSVKRQVVLGPLAQEESRTLSQEPTSRSVPALSRRRSWAHRERFFYYVQRGAMELFCIHAGRCIPTKKSRGVHSALVCGSCAPPPRLGVPAFEDLGGHRHGQVARSRAVAITLARVS